MSVKKACMALTGKHNAITLVLFLLFLYDLFQCHSVTVITEYNDDYNSPFLPVKSKLYVYGFKEIERM